VPVNLFNCRADPRAGLTGASGRLAVALVLILLIQSCATPPVSTSGAAPAAVMASAVGRPQSLRGASDESAAPRSLAPTVHVGTGIFVGRSPAAAPTTTPGTTDADGEVSFNFVNVEIRDIIREIIGEQLHLGYVIDPKVQGAATVQTGAPLPRDAVLPTLENVLRANGLALVNMNGIYRVLPAEDAARASGATPSSSLRSVRPGYGIRVLPLKFSAVQDVLRVLEPYTPTGGGLQADTARNLLIAAGTTQDLDAFAQLVAVFDTDWLAGMSYAIYPLQVETAKNMAGQLEDIFGDAAEGPLAGALRIVPLERLNAILVITQQPAYLKEAKNWIDRLDAGNDETTPRLFQYYVQNSRATDLAAVLNDVLSSGGGGRAVQTVPGSTMLAVGARTGGGLGTGLGGGASSQARPSATASGGVSLAAGAQPQPLPDAGSGGAAASGAGAAGRQATPTRAANRANRTTLGGSGSVGGGDLETPVVRVVADDKNNALVIFAKPRDYRMIESTIKRLDIIPLQVLIEATIAEVTLNDSLTYGLQFFLKNGKSSFTLSNIAPTVAGVFPGFNYVLGGSSATVVLNALSSVTDVNVVSSPQLMVLDHQTALLQVGDQVPIPTQQSQSVLTPGAPIINTIEYRDTGVILTVMPRVNSSGLVTLDITQEVSDVARTTSSTLDAPTINQRRITTSVIVQDGATVALGGLITDNANRGKSGIPILSDIPILGALFGTTSNAKKRTELLVMLSPKVVRNAQEAFERTEELRDRMHAVKPLGIKVR
jgi:general secretion pathway protein D